MTVSHLQLRWQNVLQLIRNLMRYQCRQHAMNFPHEKACAPVRAPEKFYQAIQLFFAQATSPGIMKKKKKNTCALFSRSGAQTAALRSSLVAKCLAFWGDVLFRWKQLNIQACKATGERRQMRVKIFIAWEDQLQARLQTDKESTEKALFKT